MKKVISKELLSEVFGFKIIQLRERDESKPNRISYVKDVLVESVNIHELAHHNCKGWAYEHGYIFGSGMALSSWGYAELYTMESIEELGDDAKPVKVSSAAVPEYENIFRCCQWILDENKTN